MAEHEAYQLEGSAPELYERYLVPTITALWAVDLVEIRLLTLMAALT